MAGSAEPRGVSHMRRFLPVLAAHSSRLQPGHPPGPDPLPLEASVPVTPLISVRFTPASKC